MRKPQGSWVSQGDGGWLYTHPRDPHMMMTSHEGTFIKHIQAKPETACILERPYLKGNLSEYFARQTPKTLKEMHAVLVATHDDKDVKFSPHPEIFYRAICTNGSKVPEEPLLSEIEHLSSLFRMGTGHKDQVVFMFGNRENARGQHHTHKIPTMTCTWLNSGTQWENEHGERLQAETGSVVYVPAEFEHGSLDDLGDDPRRYLSVWQPA